MNNIQALIETFGLASMEYTDDKPTLIEVTQFKHSKNILSRFGADPSTITQDDIDKAWDAIKLMWKNERRLNDIKETAKKS